MAKEDLLHGRFLTIPMKVVLDDSLKPNAKILHGIIDNLCGATGYCFASNSYLSEYTGWHVDTISGLISDLLKKKYIERDDVPNKTGIERRIWTVAGGPVKNPRSPRSKRLDPVGEKTGHNKLILNNKDKLPEDKSSAEVKSTLYPDAVKLYDDFYRGLTGLGCKFDGASGKALKSVLSYLKTNSVVKSDAGVLAGLQYIFTNWGVLDTFLRDQVKMIQINSNLPNIINQLRNGKAGKGNKSEVLRDLEDLKRQYSSNA